MKLYPVTLMVFKLVRMFNYICADLILYNNYLALNECDWNGKE